MRFEIQNVRCPLIKCAIQLRPRFGNREKRAGAALTPTIARARIVYKGSLEYLQLKLWMLIRWKFCGEWVSPRQIDPGAESSTDN